MGAVADRGDEQQLREEDGIVDNLNAFYEVLVGFKVCDGARWIRC